MEFIHGTTLVHLKMRCWSGEKKASRDSDIGLGIDGKLPPQKLLDLGRRRSFLPKLSIRCSVSANRLKGHVWLKAHASWADSLYAMKQLMT